jgi:hypothetical protein
MVEWKKEVTKMFRDFIYLDTNRVQSILSQLEGGLTTALEQASDHEVSTGGSLGLGVLGQFIGLQASAQGRASFSSSENKVLHDYAFNVALTVLDEQRYLLKSPELYREDDPFPLRDGSFILIGGKLRILDYGVFPPLLELVPLGHKHWSALQPLLAPFIPQLSNPGAQPEVQQLDATLPQDGKRITNSQKRKKLRLMLEQQARDDAATVTDRDKPSGVGARDDQSTNTKDTPNGVNAAATDTLAALANSVETITSVFEAALGDVIQFNLETVQGTTFIGNLTREFL